MKTLLNVNRNMNAYNLSSHYGDRPLYENLLSLGKGFPRIVSSIEDYPLFPLAVERNEETKYNEFLSQFVNLHLRRDDIKKGPRLG